MKKITLLVPVLLIGIGSFGQAITKCATNHLLQNRLQNNASYKQAYESLKQKRQETSAIYLQNLASGIQLKTTQTNYVVPVVFHVLLTQAKITQLGGVAGVKARMISQLDAMNADYNAKNADSASIPNPFKPLFGNAGITFSPAHRTPNNTSTEGFEITVTTISSFSINSHDGSDPKLTAYGGVPAWDANRYLNIWVVDITENTLLGYTIPPSFMNFGFALEELGVVIDYGNFGKRTSGGQYFNPGTNDLGRTLTHEVGHFFELEHVFGQNTTCTGTGDDGIADTPPQSEATYNTTSACPVFPKFDVCSPSGNGIMFMNYMDYVDDKCMYLFTKGQVNLMRDQFVSSGVAISLSQHPEVLQWPTAVGNVNDNSNASFSVYPNPSNAVFEVQCYDATRITKLAVINTFGQLVFQKEAEGMQQFSLDLSNHCKAVYLLQITTNQGTETRKIVLE